MLLANTDFEQTLKLPAQTISYLRQSGSGREPQAPLAASVMGSLKDAGIMAPEGGLTVAGQRLVGIVSDPVQQLVVRQVHALEENAIHVFFGRAECVVWARIINAQGVASGECILSRTTAENALQHVLAWVDMPVVAVPDDALVSADAEDLAAPVFSIDSRGWRVSSSALPGDVNIFYRHGALWRLKGVAEAEGARNRLVLQAEDSLSLNMLIHYVWGLCVQGLGAV